MHKWRYEKDVGGPKIGRVCWLATTVDTRESMKDLRSSRKVSGAVFEHHVRINNFENISWDS